MVMLPTDSSGSPYIGSRGGDDSRKRYDDQTVIPVTIRMILNSKGSGTLDGRPLHVVKFVGAVRCVEEQESLLIMQVEDGTGLIVVKQWLDPSDFTAVEEMRKQVAQPNIYIRVIGQVKGDAETSVVGYNMKRLSSSNELTHHFLEVVYSAEKHKKRNNSLSNNFPQSNMISSNYQSSSPYRPIIQNRTTMNFSNPSSNTVANYIKVEGSKSDRGVNMNHCIQVLSNQYLKQEIEKVFNDLTNSGQIYSTCDEMHFKHIDD